MERADEWMQRHQVALGLAALALGAVSGLAASTLAPIAGAAVTPLLALLIYATFLSVPFARIGAALRDGRFLATVMVLNFVVVPVVVLLLSRIVAHDRGLLAGVLLVLLTPCIDYVIVFTGLAGGDRERLLAASPLLMLAQMALLPVYLWCFGGGGIVTAIDMSPFVAAFVALIAAPLVAAMTTQTLAARSARLAWLQHRATGWTVPLMMATLAAVVASQIRSVGREASHLLLAMAVFALFAVVMSALGPVAGRLARLDVRGRRAVVFSGVTRNSLVVLPLALAMPEELSLAAPVVVAQTLVELPVMVALMHLMSRFIRDRKHSLE